MLIALFLGIVEGLTEFLPVSSTGHLIIAGHLLGFRGPKADSFEVFIQLGAILAVVWLFWGRFVSLFDWRQTNAGLSGKRGLLTLFLTTLPALVIGFFAQHAIKEYLFNVYTVAIGLGLGGIALIVIERWLKNRFGNTMEALTFRQGLAIGFFQVLAMWPGVSRSGATIMGGMITGLNREAAVEYSFLAAVPVMIAATAFDLLKSLPQLHSSDIPVFGFGFVVAFLTAIVAVKSFIKLVRHVDFQPFGWYRIALALLVILLARYGGLMVG